MVFGKLYHTSLCAIILSCIYGNVISQENETAAVKITNETVASEWLSWYNDVAQDVYYEREIAAWNYESNLTEHNQKLSIAASVAKANFRFEAAQNASQFDWSNFKSKDVIRQFSKITNIGTSALKNKTQLRRLSELVAEMQSIYSSSQVCLTGEECRHLEPGLAEILSSDRSYERLLSVWKTWRDVTGRKIRPLFTEYVELSNRAIREAGYNNTGEYWRSDYGPGFQENLKDLLENLKPLYENLHIYVRRRLRAKYGAKNFPSTGHIPAHLLGNMWGQQWNNILDMLLPYPNKQSVDVTPQMVAQNYTPLRMFKTSERFFTDLGLLPMPETFWNDSIIARPTDGRQLTCHASAWDFYNAKDFRIKMCTQVTMEDLLTIHHEMGHIQYFLQYKDQPLVYREGANAGFHEAVGDTLALSVGTPKHLRSIKLLSSAQTSEEDEINHLMKMALEKIAFLPFGYLIDMYRWDVFSGDVSTTEYNKHWWDLRCKYQGLSPPTWRNEDDFDPGAKYHIAADIPYIRYFVSFVIQFQFHKALCTSAGQPVPLYNCDINKSKKAGQLLSNMLKLGSSTPWPEAMKVLTGQSKMNASALMEYFSKLTNWLEAENRRHNDTQGWDDQCPQLNQEEMAQKWLAESYEVQAESMAYQSAVADWNYNTNLTDFNQALSVDASLRLSSFSKEISRNASQYQWETFKDEDTRRQFEKITNLGTSALDDKNKVKRLKELTTQMESIYGQGKVCLDSSTCLQLDPDINRLMASDRDYDKLQSVWEGWRKSTGMQMKSLYEEFVNISNEAVRAAGYNDTGEEWRSAFETNTFKNDVKGLMEQLKPLYQQLHAYVRGKLRKFYGEDKFPTSGHIPAHLLGNMWAQQWGNVYDIVQPYKNQPDIDVSRELQKQKFTPVKMFQTSEEFYTSIGLLPMPESFWTDSMITRPTDGRQVVCHPSAWDFHNRHDYRIKMCTDVNMENLIIIHHEMGHIQYYLQYRNLPIAFRTGANPGFHEAVGDTLALSVSTPGHLRRIGLLSAANMSYESDINFLLKTALDKIAFLPFGYLIDQWRWSVFNGETKPEDYNTDWWQLRCQQQGLSSPVTRKQDDFDPGSKYHVASNVPYIRYFVSFVIQFQFHKALCDAAGFRGPLHQCDIYQSKEAGNRLGEMLKMGASKPWSDAMFRITGQRNMDAGPLMEYFEPLMEWLKKENQNENIGWSESCPPPPTPRQQRACPTQSPATDSANNLSPMHLTSLFFCFVLIYLKFD